MSNKRVSQLVELTANEVANDDLFLIIDSSAHESKRIVVGDIFTYLNASGSVLAVHALFADTASFILGSNVFGVVESASHAEVADDAFSSSFAQNSINTVSASYSITASFAQSAIVPSPIITGSTYPVTTSYANISLVAKTASYLQYSGFPNGTASFAFFAQNTSHVTTADTASYFNNVTIPVATASWAENAGHSNISDSSSYLIYSPNNGTASYAIRAGNISSNFIDYGVFLAITQSNDKSTLDTVDIISAANDDVDIYIEAMGNLKVPFTASTLTSGIVQLMLINRASGVETFLDSSSIDIDISPIISMWSSNATGSISFPFSLMGQSTLSGSYAVYVTASSDVYLDINRTVRFNIGSKADGINVQSDEPLQFSYTPSSTLIDFSSSLGGPFSDTNENILGSGSNNITWLDMSEIAITSVRYLWSLPNLTGFVYENNFVPSINGMPSNLSHFDCNSGLINSIDDMSNIISMSFFDCSGNVISILPSLPQTISYFNCSSNPITTLPTNLPFGLNEFICDSTSISSVGSTFPDTLVSMSLNENSLLSSFFSALPTSLEYISFDSSSITTIGSLPTNLTELHFSASKLSSMAVDTICSTLVSNGQINGTLDIRATGIPSPSALTDIGLLQADGWIVLYDI